MTLRMRIGWSTALGCIAASVASNVCAQTVRQGLVIDRVTIVDVRSGRLHRGRAVIIADGKIVAVTKAGTVRVTGVGRRVDGQGRFLVPGFNDMHAHNLNTDGPETSLPLMLANGITGFRQMAGSPALLAARATNQALLPADSPALLAMPGFILAGPAFASAVAVTAEVRRQKAQGADFIKVVDLPPASLRAAAVAARANGLPFVGHLPPAEDAREAMRLGMGSIEHLGPGVSLLLNCSRDEAPIRAIMSANDAHAESSFNGGPQQFRRMLVNPLLFTPSQGFAVVRRVLATYDETKCRAFARDVAASNTWMVPTLGRLEAMELGNAPELRNNPDLRLVSAASRALWQDVGEEFDRRMTPENRQILADLFAAHLRLTGTFNRAGVRMLAGTDFGGGWIVPGSSLHREFDLLARAGVPPLRVLQMTTIDAALFLNRRGSMGSVEAGRDANLVLLERDPTVSVANLHGIAAVVRAGRFLDRAALDAIVAKATLALH